MFTTIQSKRSALGFTLIELLTVIAIIGILAAILIPVVGRVRESANRSKCGSNVRMLVQACHIYAEEVGFFPAVEENFPPPSGPQRNWIIVLSEGDYTDRLVAARDDPDTIWFCPTAIRYRNTSPGNANSYGMNDQTGLWFGQRRPADSPDRAEAPTFTSMVMDGSWTGSNWRTWTSANEFPDFVHPPPSNPDDPSAGINVAFMDGHVEFRKQSEVPTSSTDVFWSGVPE